MLNDLEKIAKHIRRSIVKMAHNSYASHTGSALSIVDILAVLYFRVLNIASSSDTGVERDRFILSKGHASAALYATLAEKGIISKKLLEGYYCDDGILPGHIDHKAIRGLEASTGSLGHGLSIGIGMAIAMKFDSSKNNVYVLTGDGELNEGQCWEAIMFAAHSELDNITLIVDYNRLQGYGKNAVVLNMKSLVDKFLAFGWEVLEVEGHNYLEVEKGLKYRKKGKPVVMIAKTVKGKGVSYMEDSFIWHYKSPNKEELNVALRELS
jgi:transketolase